MPASSAAPTTCPALCASGAMPNVAVPRQIFDTFTPVRPSREYSIGSRSSAVDHHRMSDSQRSTAPRTAETTLSHDCRLTSRPPLDDARRVARPIQDDDHCLTRSSRGNGKAISLDGRLLALLAGWMRSDRAAVLATEWHEMLRSHLALSGSVWPM